MRNEKISGTISRRRNAFCTLETHFFAFPHSWRAKQRNKQAITRRVSFQGDKKGFVSASRLERASSGSDILFEDKYRVAPPPLNSLPFPVGRALGMSLLNSNISLL